MKGLIVAIQFLTRLPTPRIAVSSDEFAASMRWFPAVGLIVGALVAGAGWAGTRIDPWTGALAALILWVAVTGALHLDGLGDIADASGAAHKARGRLSAVEDRERLIAVLGDPHAGSFAVVAIALQLIAKLVLLHALIDREAFIAIALIPFAARIGPLAWSRALPDLHAGLGSRFRNAVRPIDFIIWSLLLIAAAWLSPSLLAAPLVFLLWGWWLLRRIGGISGDGHGAGIEVGESLLLAAALVAIHPGPIDPGVFLSEKKSPSSSGEGSETCQLAGLVAAGGGHRPTAPTPTQCQVNRPPDGLGHAGGMTSLTLLKGRGLSGAAIYVGKTLA